MINKDFEKIDMFNDPKEDSEKDIDTCGPIPSNQK